MNPIGYFEIQADDCQRASHFYKEIFDWEFVRDEHIPVEYYRMIDMRGSGILGAILKRPIAAPAPEQGTNAYVCSIKVEDFDATEKKILDAGGSVALPRFAIPGRCWQGYFLDTEGNTFGLFQVDDQAK